MEDQALVHPEVQAAVLDLTVYQEVVVWAVGWAVE